MRPALLPGLLQAAARNQARGSADLALFEVGPVFSRRRAGRAASADRRPAGRPPRRRATPGARRRPVDLYDAKADAEAVLAAMGAPAKVQILRGGAGWWHPGRHGHDLPRAEEGAGRLRRAAPEGAARAGREGAGGRPSRCGPRRSPSRAVEVATRPALRLDGAAGGRARFRLRRRCRGRGAEPGQCRRRRRQGADRTGARCSTNSRASRRRRRWGRARSRWR